jgi:hypothetical protein
MHQFYEDAHTPSLGWSGVHPQIKHSSNLVSTFLDVSRYDYICLCVYNSHACLQQPPAQLYIFSDQDVKEGLCIQSP